MTRHFDTLIIGAGPGGTEAARLAASTGTVAIIEADRAGGTCLNRGCIPTKRLNTSARLLRDAAHAADFGVNFGSVTADYTTAIDKTQEMLSMMSDSVKLGLEAKAEYITGVARFTGERTVEVGDDTITADRIIIATGSRPAKLPIPGAELAMTSDDFLSCRELPTSVTIIGGGVIGLEFASILAAFGSQVTVVEFCKEVLPPFDSEIAKRLRTYLTRSGIRFVMGAAATSIERGESGLKVSYQGKKGIDSIDADAVIMAVGRKAVVPEGLDNAGIELTTKGFIAVDDDLRTSAEGVYAIGDCNGMCLLAHAAEAQARAIFLPDIDLTIIPSAVFTLPEAGMVGLTEDYLKANGSEYAVAKSGFGTNGKAMAMGETDGLVKWVYEPSTGVLLGCHIVGPHAADLCATAAVILANASTRDEVAHDLILAHPTLPEALIMPLR